jgi:hypothetical protein
MHASDSEPMLTLAELRRALMARGLEFSNSQLKHLRREGLLPTEGQRHVVGVRGSESLYPGWAVRQLELVARLAATERRFAQLRVQVRWHGGWVRADRLRESLIDLLEPMSAAVRRVTATAVGDGDQADRLAQALAGHRGRSGMSRLMRRRLNNVGDDIEQTMYAFAALATGSALEWENHDDEDSTESLVVVVERALGFDRARRDDIGGQGPLLRERESSQEILAELQQAGAFDLLNLGAEFAAATDDAIERAFQDAIAFAGVAEAFEAIESLAGDDVAGFGSISELGGAHEAVDLVMLVRGLLLLRPLTDPGALEAVVDAAAAAAPQLRVAQELSRALPRYARLLAPGGSERLAALPAEERDRISGEIRAYLEARPELAALVETPGGSGVGRAQAAGPTEAVRPAKQP